MSFPKYPEYKDSGVGWLGKVPAHWDVRRLRFVAELNPSKSEVRSLPTDTQVSFIPMGSVGDDGSLALVQTRPLGEVLDGYTYVRENDVAVAKITPCFENGKAAIMRGLHNNVGLGTTELTVMRPKSLLTTSEYLFRVVTSEPFRVLGESSMYGAGGQKRVPDDFIRNFNIAWPPQHEQRAIAAFLDHETAHIDALVKEQQCLIELLKEKRQAVISHAVTKGLDADVPMKDSGVEWLGEVPAHWEVKRVKYVVKTFEQGWSPQCESGPVGNDQEYGVLKVGCVNNGVFRSGENKKLPEGVELIPELTLKADDLLISRANIRELVGNCAVPAVDYPNLMISDKLFRLRLEKSMADPHFLSFFLGAPQARRRIEIAATGASSSMLNIGQGTILEMIFPCPPIEEQAEIRDKIVKQNWKILYLAAEALNLVQCLEEHRSALISAAVTGKIDVRGWRSSEAMKPEQLKAAEEAAGYDA